MSEAVGIDAGRGAGTLNTGLDEASLEEAIRLAGYDHRGARVSITITADNVRDFCNYIGNPNPLYTEPARGVAGRFGRPLAPPTMVGTAIIAPGLRGVQWIYGGASWRFPGLFGPGDVISQTGRLIGAEMKSGRSAAQMIVQQGRTTCTNQHGEVVVEADLYCTRIPRRRAKGGLNYAQRDVRWTTDDLEELRERLAKQASMRRGAELRYFEDVAVGDEIQPLSFGPLRLSDIALTRGSIVFGIIGGKESDGGFGYMLNHYRRHPSDSYVNPETGVAEHPHRGHWETFMAREVGMPGIYDVGYQRLGWLSRAVTDWMGDDGRLRALEGWLRRPNIVGDVTTIAGRVVAKRRVGGQALVDCSFSGLNQADEETLTGSATVELVSRAVDVVGDNGDKNGLSL
jgi:acyl dehydratase